MNQSSSELRVFFAFDLDGTITREEILVALAEISGIQDRIARDTQATLDGRIGFAESFSRRFELLRGIAVPLAQERISRIPLDPDIVAFIRANPERCVVITGNLDRWVAPILARLGCRAFTSTSSLRGGVLRLESVLDKGRAVRGLRRELPPGTQICAIGDSAGDLAMFEAADYAIAFAGVNTPPPALLRAAKAQAASGRDLRAMLEGIKKTGLRA